MDSASGQMAGDGAEKGRQERPPKEGPGWSEPCPSGIQGHRLPQDSASEHQGNTGWG